MSTWVGIELGGFTIEEWQNTYHKWVFSELDRVREISENETFIGYRLSADKLKRRLELKGVNRESVELEFKELKARWIKDIQEDVASFNEHENSCYLEYVKYLNGLQNCSLDSWIKLIPIAKNQTSNSQDNTKLVLSEAEQNLLEFMLSNYDEYPDYTCGGFHFPCLSSESYAWVILELTDPNVVCELNVFPLIDSGWIDDFGDIAESQAGYTKFFESAKLEIEAIIVLCNSDVKNPVLQRLSFSALITIMETYLSDIAKRQVLNKQSIKRRFVERFKPFYTSQKNICVSKIFQTLEQLDSSILDHINTLSFHNIETINTFYSNVLLIDLPKDIQGELAKCVQIRHDIVHRTGKTIKGEIVEISNQTVKKQAELVLVILKSVDSQIVDGLLEN
ncbi:HEPN/Toprim-associated domain-containing protein [Shewanella sp. M-Br]|uniref:HEPN/Toprim-associated domain-containing protein n=1 Tax=Shewanella sp. M-Br TaxID=2495595 RepID=UPI002949BF43|nr:hypothetical protein SMBr_13830 [Shewanella sp. M-Br]